MAEVFLADAVDANGEQVSAALKLMKPGVSDEAFADEADLMGLLQHPNLVQLLESGVAFGRPFIAMEFLIGGDLAGLMRVHRKEMRATLSRVLHLLMNQEKPRSKVLPMPRRNGGAQAAV